MSQGSKSEVMHQCFEGLELEYITIELSPLPAADIEPLLYYTLIAHALRTPYRMQS